ncbi:MAG: rhodanese-like domain-containing protein [Proteobacteria bacterium]|nr:rhodanese-like domain-containing protein [Pseudomonadota bacterium]
MATQTSLIKITIGILFFFCAQNIGAVTLPEPSGQLVDGFRVLPVPGKGEPLEWIVFRGDYIKFDIGTAAPDTIVSIPSLSIEEPLTAPVEKAPYFKMKETGVFDLFIGSLAGNLTVVEYNPINYEAVSAQKAMEVMAVFSPLILDVRTPQEYALGHIENSVLIPIGQLQTRLEELAGFKDDPILIYCATGNRSTVAAKILIDSGFSRIFNLRHGIADWAKNKFPIVK